MDFNKMSKESLEEMRVQIDNALKNKKEVIAGIDFEGNIFDNRLGIVFGKKVLVYNREIQSWIVDFNAPEDNIKCKLVQVDSSKLETGKVYLRTDEDDYRSKGFLSHYCIHLKKGKYVYISQNTDVLEIVGKYNYWYECVPMEEN